MSFDLNEFRSNILRPARPTLFEVFVSIPSVTDLRFRCEATQIPGVNNGQYPIHYQGRQIKFAGDRTFEDWNVTVIQTETGGDYDSILNWFNIANDPETGLRSTAFENSSDYKGIAEVSQLTQTGDEFARFTLDGVFPVKMAPIDLRWADVDKYVTFNVTFAYDWLTKTR